MQWYQRRVHGGAQGVILPESKIPLCGTCLFYSDVVSDVESGPFGRTSMVSCLRYDIHHAPVMLEVSVSYLTVSFKR